MIISLIFKMDYTEPLGSILSKKSMLFFQVCILLFSSIALYCGNVFHFLLFRTVSKLSNRAAMANVGIICFHDNCINCYFLLSSWSSISYKHDLFICLYIWRSIHGKLYLFPCGSRSRFCDCCSGCFYDFR
jgi:hypothetical protein